MDPPKAIQQMAKGQAPAKRRNLVYKYVEITPEADDDCCHEQNLSLLYGAAIITKIEKRLHASCA